MRFVASFLSVVLIASSSFGDAIEEWVEASPEPEAMQEWLDGLQHEPLDLNSVNAEDLERLPFFDEEISKRIVEARESHRYFGTLENVLANPDLTPEQREALRLFTTVKQPTEHAVARGTSRFSDGEPQSRLRADFISHGSRGFLYVVNKPASSDVSAGIEFRHKGSSSRFVAGDYQIETGTGLVVASAYGMSNWLGSPLVLNPSASQGLRLRPTTAALSRFRGVAVQTNRGWLSGMIFASIQRLDAARDSNGLVRIIEGTTADADLRSAREDQVEERVAGFELEGRKSAFTAGTTAFQSRFAPSVAQSESASESPESFGSRLSVGSVHVGGSLGKASILSEAAKSDPGDFAHQSALSVVGDRLGFSLYHVFASDDFYSPHSKVWGGFGDEAGNNQRTGLKFRIAWPREILSMHAWSARSPFRTAEFPLHRNASGLEMRSETKVASTLSLVLHADRNWAEEPGEVETDVIEVTRGRVELTADLHYELKLRAEVKTAGVEGSSSYSTGTLLFLQAKHIIRETSVFLRITIYDAEDYRVTLRAYENAPVGMFPLVTFANRGRRAAMMISRNFGVVQGALKLAHTAEYGIGRGEHLEAALQLGLTW